MGNEGKGFHERKELKELRHDPVPGYRAAFYVAFLLGLIYLASIFFFAR